MKHQPRRNFLKSGLTLGTAAAATALLAACGGSDDPAPPPAAPARNIVQLAQATPDLSILVEAVVAAGLVDALSAPGPLTVFAPTNAAFAALLDELKTDKAGLLGNLPLLTSVLQYHVLGSRVARAGIPLGAPIDPILAGTDTFVINASGSNLVITDGRNRTSNITTTDIVASNGLVHLIDKVILPPAAPAAPQNIVQLAQATPDLSILVEAVVAAGLVDALSAPGPLTVFAPTNAAFAALLDELKTDKAGLLGNLPLLTTVLQYHVLGSSVKKADIPLGKAIDPILSGTADVFKIDVVGANVVITDGRNRTSNITATDIMASNGVVHLIDKVILPADKDIVATAQSVSDFSTLVAAVGAAGLVPTLQSAGPFTVFAPTNAAFTAALTELGIDAPTLLGNVPLLTSILTYHVVPGRVLKADVPVGQAITTVQGATFVVDSTLAITDSRNRKANITSTDVFATNGVIHTIDNVILPPVAPAAI
jgi:uncharacterized surface protein with fasciclin (FAS1) repeats